jgi:hypothetical protein
MKMSSFASATVLSAAPYSIQFANAMPEQDLPLSIFHMLERNVGKKIRVILDPSYGFEGTLMAVTGEPAGIWLSEAEAIVLRSTMAQPIPQVASREERSEIMLNLHSIQRIEVLHAPPSRREK